MEAVRSAAGAGDAESLAKAAHAFKGMVSNFCAEPATAAALRVEEMGRAGALDGVDDCIATLQSETDRLRSGLDELLKGLGA
jgi:HPt (histidine-containing phosphotransfer) domain-containing protein